MPVYEDVEKLLEDIGSDVHDALNEAFPGSFDIVEPFADVLPIGERDVTAVPWVWRGVHSGDFYEARRTGNPVEVTGVTLVRLDDGELIYHRIVDWQTLYRQIGFLMVCRRPRTPDTNEVDTIDIPGSFG
jgi:hypothetical protein